MPEATVCAVPGVTVPFAPAVGVMVKVVPAWGAKEATIVWFAVTLENVYVGTAPTEVPSTRYIGDLVGGRGRHRERGAAAGCDGLRGSRGDRPVGAGRRRDGVVRQALGADVST